MQIHTTRFGTVDVDERQVITFPGGLIGFPAGQRFALMDRPEIRPFQWLQALDDTELAFIVIDPNVFFPDYDAEIDAVDAQALGIETQEDALVLVIASVGGASGARVTVNLLAPIIIGAQQRLAAQIIQDPTLWSVQTPVPSRQEG